MNLRESEVLFNQEEHTYTIHGKKLKGITGMLHRQLFPDEYKDVPEHILRQAAERGTLIHETCELVDELNATPSSVEGANYLRVKTEHGLMHECSEYLVSDEEHFASNIDKVYRVSDDTFILADIKTTYKVNKDYIRWQLSIYAYLFELQNKGARVERLYGIWLRGDKAELIEVDRVPAVEIRRLLDCEIEGTQFSTAVISDSKMPDKYLALQMQIAEIESQAKYWADKKKELLSGIKEEMDAAGVIKWVGDSVTITRKRDTEREDFDKASFKKAYPEIYSEFIKRTPVSGGVTIKIH